MQEVTLIWLWAVNSKQCCKITEQSQHYLIMDELDFLRAQIEEGNDDDGEGTIVGVKQAIDNNDAFNGMWMMSQW